MKLALATFGFFLTTLVAARSSGNGDSVSITMPTPEQQNLITELQKGPLQSEVTQFLTSMEKSPAEQKLTLLKDEMKEVATALGAYPVQSGEDNGYVEHSLLEYHKPELEYVTGFPASQEVMAGTDAAEDGDELPELIEIAQTESRESMRDSFLASVAGESNPQKRLDMLRAKDSYALAFSSFLSSDSASKRKALHDAIAVAEKTVAEKKLEIAAGRNEFANEILNSEPMSKTAETRKRIKLIKGQRWKLKAHEGEKRFILDQLITNEAEIGKYYEQYFGEYAGQRYTSKSGPITGRTELGLEKTSLRDEPQTIENHLKVKAIERLINSKPGRLDVRYLLMKKNKTPGAR
jgi:hypothetical protein